MTMIDPAIVLFANDAFYLAFNNRDIDAMDNLWSRFTPPVCIHPGWTAMFNRNEIMESWKDIFINQEAGFRIQCHEPTVLFQQDVMSVICFEQLPQGWLVATNNFVMEGGEPKLIHHQGSPIANPPEAPEQPPPRNLQ